MQSAKDKFDFTVIDIGKFLPNMFDSNSLNAYVKKHYMGMQITEQESKSLKFIQEALKELKSADNVVLAYPMYNFSMPAAVKAWFDSVIVAGETFKMESGGGFVGLCKDKKALILTTSGGMYDKEPLKNFDHSTPLATSLFTFMGFQTSVVFAQGLNSKSGMDNLNKAIEEVKNTAKNW